MLKGFSGPLVHTDKIKDHVKNGNEGVLHMKTGGKTNVSFKSGTKGVKMNGK
jgi:hypothetical protein